MTAAATEATTSTATTALPRVDPAGMRVIWLLLFAAFVAVLNETTMGIAIPHLNADLGLPPELGQWLTSAYMLTMAVVIPTTGFLLQRFTTRFVYLAAMSLFTAGTLLCLVAPDFGLLLTGRVVQAIGTAVMMPLLMTTMMDVVPPQLRGRMMGRVGIVISLAPAIGPTLAGLVLDTLHWRWIFGIVLPISIAVLLIGAKWMLNLGTTTQAPFDAPSVVLAALGFGGFVFGLSQFGGEGSVLGPALGGGLLAVSALVLALFAWRQLRLQRSDRALLDLRVFRSGNFTISVTVMTVLALSLFGTVTLLPLYLQNVVGLDALSSGLVTLPGSLAMGLLGPLIGRIYDATGPRVLLVPGTALVAVALFFYATVDAHTPVWLIVLVQTAMFIGMALSFTPLFSASLGSLAPRFYSHGSAVLNTLQQVGGAAGVAILVTAYSAALHRGQAAGEAIEIAGAAGARIAFLIAAVVMLAAVAGAAFVRRPADQEPAAS